MQTQFACIRVAAGNNQLFLLLPDYSWRINFYYINVQGWLLSNDAHDIDVSLQGEVVPFFTELSTFSESLAGPS
jgi:hypothetical protein